MLRTTAFAAPPKGALWLLLFLAFTALTHSHALGHGDMDIGMGMNHDSGGTESSNEQSNSTSSSPSSDSSGPMSYFAYQKHAGSIIAHIALMVIAWFFILPIGTHIIISYTQKAICERKEKEIVQSQPRKEVIDC